MKKYFHPRNQVNSLKTSRYERAVSLATKLTRIPAYIRASHDPFFSSSAINHFAKHLNPDFVGILFYTEVGITLLSFHGDIAENPLRPFYKNNFKYFAMNLNL